MVRFLILLVVVAGLAAGGWYGYRNYTKEEAPTVLTTPVVRGDIEETVLASGILKPARLVAVGAQESGRITKLHVAVGDTVKSGDLVAEIDSKTQVNALRTAKAALENLKAQKKEREATLSFARSELKRQKSLLAQHATAQSEYDSAVETVATTEAQIDQLSAQIVEGEVAVETAEVNLGYTRVTAPADGTVLWVSAQEGQTVNAIQSAPTIVILGQLDTMRVRAEISEVDVVKVKPGQEVYFTILGDPDNRREAKLETIEPAPESITSDSSLTSSSVSSGGSSSSTSAIYYNGVFTVPNPDGALKTYMTAEVHIIVGFARDALIVPSAALVARRDDSRYTVRVQDRDGAITDRTVEVGLDTKVRAQILSGLQEGDRVVIGDAAGASAERAGGRRRPRIF